MNRLRLHRWQASHSPVHTSQRTLLGRTSFILEWASVRVTSRGEACPLPGFGRDDPELAEQELESLRPGDVDEAIRRVASAYREFTASRGSLAQPRTDSAVRMAPSKLSPDPFWDSPQSPLVELGKWSQRFHSPSARFCVETVVLGAAAGACGVPLVRLLAAGELPPHLPTSAVLDPSRSDVGATVRALRSMGIETFKIKCGRSWVEERALLEHLAQDEQPPRVRLDPNGAWSVRQLDERAAELATAFIDWIEDPTPEPADWSSVGAKTTIPLALDEPLSRMSGDEAAQIVSSPELSFGCVILKPMALGGFAACARLAACARAAGRSTSVSHFFDGPIAMDATIALAFAVQSPKTAPGLGPHAALQSFAGSPWPRSRWMKGHELVCPQG